jgi:hypothetical protein
MNNSILHSFGCAFVNNASFVSGVSDSSLVEHSTGVYASSGVYGSKGVVHSSNVYCSIAINNSWVVTECKGLSDSCFCNEVSGQYLLFNKPTTRQRIIEVITDMPQNWEGVEAYAKSLPEFDENVWDNIKMLVVIYKKMSEVS